VLIVLSVSNYLQMAPVSQLVAIKLAFINKANYVTIALKVVFHALQRLTALNAITI
jgi:hypothetical protein